MIFLLRIVALLALAYAAWYLVRSYQALQQGKDQEKTLPEQESAAQDQLVEDPVCHVLLPKEQALRLRSGQTTHYFCSEKCCDQFIDKQEREEE